MRPELFTIPFINLSIPAYGVMMVTGFICALFLSRYLCRRLGENPEHIANFAVYALLAGVIGARLFYVLHNLSYYKQYPREIIAVWSGGLEFYGGFIGASLVMIIYFRRKKLSILKFLDILAPALMIGLSFGRIGCFLNGCCFGAPTSLPWAIKFPPLVHTHRTPDSGCQRSPIPQYSIPYAHQLLPDRQRHPDGRPLLELPTEFYDGYSNDTGHWIASLELLTTEERKDFHRLPKSPSELTSEQLILLESGAFPMLPIHPTQLYSFLNALLLGLLLTYLILRHYRFKGQIFFLMIILYGIARFILEHLRADNPIEFDGFTISQNLSLIAIPLGLIMLLILSRHRIRPS